MAFFYKRKYLCFMKLSELQKDSTAIITSLEALKDVNQIRLMEIGFVAGKQIKHLQSSILNGPISYEIEGTIIALSKSDTEKIEIS